MEELVDTRWDVVLAGTGRALSRSGKKVIHVDQNGYYGGEDAALSLQDAEEWVKTVNSASYRSTFGHAEIFKREDDEEPLKAENPVSKLAFSRAYSLSLSPQLIYTRSALLPTLVTSKVHRQLEFLAVGDWWIYNFKDDQNKKVAEPGTNDKGTLKKIPGTREDVFTDETLDRRSKQTLMRFLRLAGDAEAQSEALLEWGDKSFEDLLNSQYNMPLSLRSALHALTLSPHTPEQTTTSYALPRIYRHLASNGVFGPGFGSVIPKWGGMAEVAQIGCRAGAVGGGIYVLGRGVQRIKSSNKVNSTEGEEDGDHEKTLLVQLEDEEIRTTWVAGCASDLPPLELSLETPNEAVTSWRVSILSSPLSMLFPSTVEGAPPPAATVIVFPTGTVKDDSLPAGTQMPPVYFQIHSSDTGECPEGQCIIYSSISLPASPGYSVLTSAMDHFLESLALDSEEFKPQILWSLGYSRKAYPSAPPPLSTSISNSTSPDDSGLIVLPHSSPLDIAWDDSILEAVRQAWVKITGLEEGFMTFEERAGEGDEEDED
ncbi:MAG: Rab proteins geranylgeranyltransferase component A [Icmadophila ericetorum]|nr:Rab proteins geranylgeranyltransferase component A [Icmadophila ericetorum]